MEHLGQIIFERSLVEWDSLIKRLLRCQVPIIWVDVMPTGVDLMGKLSVLHECF
jgi:hypothetical protein